MDRIDHYQTTARKQGCVNLFKRSDLKAYRYNRSFSQQPIKRMRGLTICSLDVLPITDPQHRKWQWRWYCKYARDVAINTRWTTTRHSASYQIRKLVGSACAGNAGNVFLVPETASKRSHHGSRHVRHARAVVYVDIANTRCSRHSRRMRIPRF